MSAFFSLCFFLRLEVESKLDEPEEDESESLESLLDPELDDELDESRFLRFFLDFSFFFLTLCYSLLSRVPDQLMR